MVGFEVPMPNLLLMRPWRRWRPVGPRVQTALVLLEVRLAVWTVFAVLESGHGWGWFRVLRHELQIYFS